MVVPEFCVDVIIRMGSASPEFRAGEHHRIQVLLPNVLPIDIILEIVHTVMTVNNAMVTPNISWHSRMALGMLIFDDDCVTD